MRRDLGIIVGSLLGALLGTPYDDTCLQIEAAISSASKAYGPGVFDAVAWKEEDTNFFCAAQLTYQQDIKHWMTSSSQTAACSVEPGTAEDISIIVRCQIYQYIRF